MKQFIAFDDEAFEQIMARLDDLEKKLQPQKTEMGIGWLDNNQFCEALNISKRSAQNYRDQGLIPYSLIGGKVYYKLEDIEQLLNKHYTKVK
jgi:hypothetical protein